ncbi:MAG: anion permease [Phycisphaeraceae bacterium]|nr:anion permease [Phycisphaeraceae bacterium]
MTAERRPPDIAAIVSWIGLLAGPIVAVCVFMLLPRQAVGPDGVLTGLSDTGRATASVGALMAVWWLSEAIPLSATALLPLVLFPLTGAATMSRAAAPYADSVIFLFLGGFILGLGMERWGLHKRIALLVVLMVGTGPKRLIGGFMLASALISMWVNNTSTTIMMLPIALSVIGLVAARHAAPGTPERDIRSPDPNFDSTLLLGIAYAASIGGVATLIGTAPNAIMKGFVARELGREIGFANWLMLGLPIVAAYLPLAWLYMTCISQPVRLKTIPGGREMIRAEFAALGPMSRGEWTVFGVFLCTVTLWLTRPLLNEWGESLAAGGHGGDVLPALARALHGLNDSTIAVLAALALFVIPVRPRERVFAMDWPTAERLPWGVLLLFGGGLSLAAAITANGVDAYIGQMLGGLGRLPLWMAVLIVCAVVIFLTELTSNTAVTTALLPILAAAAPSLGVDPMRLVVPAAVAASMAFMLPVATPPNAIVFGSGRVRIGQMARAGLGLNIIGIVLITVATMIVGDGIVAVASAR